MPANRHSYRHHKASGQAFVEIGGRRIYLGKFDSPESWEKYHRTLAEHLAAPGAAPTPSSLPGAERTPLSINELILLYLQFALRYYAVDGVATKEYANVRDALRPLKELYGLTCAEDFGPKSLQILRQHLVASGLSRGHINSRVGRIKRMFKWAVAEELVASTVYHGLQAVGGLRYGRTEARETAPVKPVLDLYVALTLPFLPPSIAAIIWLQRLTGMRSGEVVIMRPLDIDSSCSLWLYHPPQHKNLWRGQSRSIPLGPMAQEIDADAWRNMNHASGTGRQRRTKVFPCELKRQEKTKLQRLAKPRRKRRERYYPSTYYRAIMYGIEKARRAGMNVPYWHPHQLRHSRATEIRHAFGLTASQAVLGHARVDVTQIYAERDLDLAERIARQYG